MICPFMSGPSGQGGKTKIECEHNRACRMAYGDEGCKPPCYLGFHCHLYERKVDRDALLALAGEMQSELDECEDDHEIVGKLQYWIDHMREALGVEDFRPASRCPCR